MAVLKFIFFVSIIFVIITIIIEVYLAQNVTKLDISKLDKIGSLPGQPPVNFSQYSGYINTDGERSLFYYFVEAEVEPESKPLVLWLNGGPGASSVGIGAFAEHGPFSPREDHLVANNFSWNKVANMLYLESPAGVGFSFSKDSSFYSYIDDDITANDNILFLENWLNRFPKYRNNDFYLMGESYAGHFIPQLADRIVKSKLKIQLKGIALGNPLLEFDTDYNARADYLWSHGLISDATYDLLNTVCNYSQIRRVGEQQGKIITSCSHVADEVALETGFFLHDFDVTLDVCLSSLQVQSRARHQFDHSTMIDVCVGDEIFVYLNREDVRQALRGLLVHVERWSPYTTRIALNYNMQNEELSMISILGSLVKEGIRVLAYSGDQDSVLPLTGTRAVINGLAKELGLSTSMPYRPWFVGRQVAGWTETYADNTLSYATIRGASHEAAYSQPERTLVLIKKFLGGEPLTVNVTRTV